MNGQIRENIEIGDRVNIVLKANQRTGLLTEGTVCDKVLQTQRGLTKHAETYASSSRYEKLFRI